MAKEEAKKSAEKESCTCGCGSDCKCGCKCSCGCGCVKKLIVLVIVFLAGIGCGCMMCCCMGCKPRHHIPAHIAMAKQAMKQPKNNVIVIRTDGDEVVPEIADGDFYRMKKHHQAPQAPEMPAEHTEEAPAPVAPEVAPIEETAEAPAEVHIEQ